MPQGIFMKERLSHLFAYTKGLILAAIAMIGIVTAVWGMRGSSKDTYDMDLRVWVRNNATPTCFNPGVGFRCVRDK
jgi:hypothetical protein